MLELAAIWIIVIATFIWFFRDERRLRQAQLEAQARYFATAPDYRHEASR